MGPLLLQCFLVLFGRLLGCVGGRHVCRRLGGRREGLAAAAALESPQAT